MKHDASKTPDERTKKQRDTPIALQVGYSKHKEQPLSEMSHTHLDLFGFVPPSSLGRTQVSTNKKCYNYVERGHLTCLCPLALNYHGNTTLGESSKTTIKEEPTK
jgi:hypothetical protein